MHSLDGEIDLSGFDAVTLKQAQGLVDAWAAEEADGFYDIVDILLATGAGTVLTAAVQILGSDDKGNADEMAREILEVAQAFSDSPTLHGKLFCMAVLMDDPSKVDAFALTRSYAQAPGINDDSSTCEFYLNWMPWLPMTTLAAKNPCELWQMKENMRRKQPPFIQDGTSTRQPGWYAVLGLIRRAQASPDEDTERSDMAVNRKMRAEVAWRRHVIKTMPGISDVIAPEAPSLVLEEWVDLLNDRADSTDTDDFREMAQKLDTLIGSSGKQSDVEAVWITFVHDDATGEDGIRACLLDGGAETLHEAFVPTSIKSLDDDARQTIEEILMASVCFQEPRRATQKAPVMEEADFTPPPGSVIH